MENPADDPAWRATIEFLRGRVPPGQTAICPPALSAVVGGEAAPPPPALPDWAVVHKGDFQGTPLEVVRELAGTAVPVFANEVFVVLARRPTFGLRDVRESEHFLSLVPAIEREEARRAEEEARREAERREEEARLAAEREEEARREALRAAARRETAAEAEGPPPLSALLGPRLTDMLRGRAPQAVLDLSGGPLARLTGLAATPRAPGTVFDLALIRPAGIEDLATRLAAAAAALRPGSAVLVVVENRHSLGRRIARVLGHPDGAGGVGSEELRGALRAAGFSPLRLEGHLLDPWRGTGEAPSAFAPGGPGEAVLEAAGHAAGPDHAAELVALAKLG